MTLYDPEMTLRIYILVILLNKTYLLNNFLNVSYCLSATECTNDNKILFCCEEWKIYILTLNWPCVILKWPWAVKIVVNPLTRDMLL